MDLSWVIAADIAAVLVLIGIVAKFMVGQARRVERTENRLEALEKANEEHSEILAVHLKESTDIRERLVRLETKVDILLEKADGS